MAKRKRVLMSERNENEVGVSDGIEREIGRRREDAAGRKEGKEETGEGGGNASSSLEVGNLGKPAMFGDQAGQRTKMDEADNYREI